MTSLALFLPLGLAVTQRSHERRLAEAEADASIVAGAIAATTSARAARQAVSRIALPTGVSVRRLAGVDESPGRASASDLSAVAAQGGSLRADVPGGVAVLVPTSGAVVEAFVADAELGAADSGVWWALASGAAVLMTLFVLSGDRVAARVARGARQLRDGAVALGDGDLRARVDPAGCRELAEAGAAFNRMADRMAQSRTSERELVADLSHRLRTPLTVLRLDAESLVGGGTADIDGELDTGEMFVGTAEEADQRRTVRRIRTAVATLEQEIDVLIQTTRQVVSTEADERADPQRCDAGEVVRDRLEFWAAVAGDQNRPFSVHGASRRAPVALARSELAAALDAVLGNVFRYTPQGTPFEVAVSRRDGYVAVRVDDGGKGIDDPDRALRRGASDQGSTGLGLDIARRATLAAQGSVSIDRAQLGGASVVMLFRDAEAPPPSANRFGLVGRRDAEPAPRRWPRQRSDNAPDRDEARSGATDA
ncbi:HAMP domain-containing sensor histidine kinase [Pilimelia columellifera]|uniref:HAMP domain-containing sensor histidine kinase n=1 Tax=Pilimelia columellifera TaxID=706574 RepID=UPI003CD0B774